MIEHKLDKKTTLALLLEKAGFSRDIDLLESMLPKISLTRFTSRIEKSTYSDYLKYKKSIKKKKLL